MPNYNTCLISRSMCTAGLGLNIISNGHHIISMTDLLEIIHLLLMDTVMFHVLVLWRFRMQTSIVGRQAVYVAAAGTLTMSASNTQEYACRAWSDDASQHTGRKELALANQLHTVDRHYAPVSTSHIVSVDLINDRWHPFEAVALLVQHTTAVKCSVLWKCYEKAATTALFQVIIPNKHALTR